MCHWLPCSFLVFSLGCYASMFLHLQADFPNASPWPEGAWTTDEGWYGAAAVQHYVVGHWYVPGSFNPAVALPVWPVMLGAWFSFAGVTLAAARALTVLLYGASLTLLYVLLRKAAPRNRAMLVMAAFAVLLTVVNPFNYVFHRLAFLEPVCTFWMMASLWLASRTGPRDVAKQVGLGVLMCLLVLTKTTGAVFIPAILYMQWSSHGGLETLRLPREQRSMGIRGGLRAAAASAGVCLGLWLLYYLFWVRPYYLADYRLLFQINPNYSYRAIYAKLVFEVMRNGRWLGWVVFWTASFGIVAAVVRLRELWKVPLFGAAVLAFVLDLVFLWYHGSLPPRYYEALVMPMMIVVALTAGALWERSGAKGQWALAAVGLLTAGWMGAQTSQYALHPRYSYLQAAQSIGAIAKADPSVTPLLFSPSCQEITLMNGMPSVCDAYLPEGPRDLLRQYHPGWYAGWIRAEGDAQPTRSPLFAGYRLQEVRRYDVFDLPDRSTLVLYKILP